MHVRGLVEGEARVGDAHRVSPGREPADDEVAFVVGDGRLFRAGRADDRDGRADKRAAELVSHLPAQGARLLREAHNGEERQHQREARAPRKDSLN